MICKWKKIGTLYTTTAYGADGMNYNLSVEKLPTRGWDWVVWHAGGHSTTIRHGYTTSAKHGMAAAENAVTDKSTRRRNIPTRRSDHFIAPFGGLHSHHRSTTGLTQSAAYSNRRIGTALRLPDGGSIGAPNLRSPQQASMQACNACRTGESLSGRGHRYRMGARHGAPSAKPTTRVTLSMRISAFDLTKSSLACAARRNVAASASVVTHRRPRISERALGQTSRRRLTSSGFHENEWSPSRITPLEAQHKIVPHRQTQRATECCDRQRFIGAGARMSLLRYPSHQGVMMLDPPVGGLLSLRERLPPLRAEWPDGFRGGRKCTLKKRLSPLAWRDCNARVTANPKWNENKSIWRCLLPPSVSH